MAKGALERFLQIGNSAPSSSYLSNAESPEPPKTSTPAAKDSLPAELLAVSLDQQTEAEQLYSPDRAIATYSDNPAA